jgi:hypothetical protein
VTHHTAAEVALAIERGFRKATTGGFGSPLVVADSVAAAEVAMSIVEPVLDARDARIAALEELAREVMAKLVPHLVVDDEVVERWKAVVSGAVQAQKLSDEKEPKS